MSFHASPTRFLAASSLRLALSLFGSGLATMSSPLRIPLWKACALVIVMVTHTFYYILSQSLTAEQRYSHHSSGLSTTPRAPTPSSSPTTSIAGCPPGEDDPRADDTPLAARAPRVGRQATWKVSDRLSG